MTDAAGSRPGRLAALTGIRGWGASIVLLHHAFVYLPDERSPLDEVAAGLVIPLYLVLDCFFVLSGMFIGRILLVDGTDRDDLVNYFVRRLLRIVPLYWLIVVSLTVLLPAAFDSFGVGGRWGELSDGLRDLAAPHLLLVHNVTLGAGTSISEFSLSHLWTVGLELHFYLLAPLVVIAFRRRLVEAATALALVCMVARGMAALNGASADAIYRQLWFHCDSLLLGVAIAAARVQGREVPWARIPFRLRVAAIPTLMCIGLALIARSPDGGYERPFTLTASAIFAVLVIEDILAGPETFWSRLCSRRHWLWLGDRSYPFYLLHVPVLVVVSLALGDRLVLGGGDEPIRLLSSAIAGLVTLGVTLVLSHVLHERIEKPLLAVADRFRAAPSGRPRATSQT